MKIDDRAQRVTFRGKSLRFSIPLPITVFRERALERRNTFFFNSLSLCSLLVPSSSSLHSIEPVVVFALLFHPTFKKKMILVGDRSKKSSDVEVRASRLKYET